MRSFADRLPMALTTLRAALGPTVLLAAGVTPRWVIAVLVAIGFVSDVADGVIARRLGIVTEGLRVADSWADALFYGCAALAAWRLEPAIVHAYRAPIVLTLCLLATSYVVSLVKYRRIASYHSWIAKLWNASLFYAFDGVTQFRNGATLWPAAIIAVFGNIEGIAMTCVLGEWTHDVPTIFHALRTEAERKVRRA